MLPHGQLSYLTAVMCSGDRVFQGKRRCQQGVLQSSYLKHGPTYCLHASFASYISECSLALQCRYCSWITIQCQLD